MKSWGRMTNQRAAKSNRCLRLSLFCSQPLKSQDFDFRTHLLNMVPRWCRPRDRDSLDPRATTSLMCLPRLILLIKSPFVSLPWWGIRSSSLWMSLLPCEEGLLLKRLVESLEDLDEEKGELAIIENHAEGRMMLYQCLNEKGRGFRWEGYDFMGVRCILPSSQLTKIWSTMSLNVWRSIV